MNPTETDDSGDLSGETTRGVLWTVVQKWSMRIGGFLTVAILTRLLNPHDFGVVAVALTLLPVLYLLSDFGFATYVVQAKEVDERLLSTAFWYSAGSGVVLAAALGFLAGPVGHLLDIDGLSAVLWGCAPVVIFVTFSSVPQALLKRRMAFRALALQAVAAAAIGQIAAIALAIAGKGVWALVGQLVVSEPSPPSASAWRRGGSRSSSSLERSSRRWPGSGPRSSAWTPLRCCAPGERPRSSAA